MNENELISYWNMIHNLASHMLLNEEDAVDATQSIFEQAISRLDSFRHESGIGTWFYRLAYNYLIDELRKRKRERITFDLFKNDITRFQEYNDELQLSREEEKIYIKEIKIGCTKALLQCLEPENRFIYIVGTIFSFPGKDAAALCNMTYDTYRARLSRSKTKIRNFLSENCGLVNPQAKCKCRKRLLIAMERGRIDPEASVENNRAIKHFISELNEADEISRIYQDNPFMELTGEVISGTIRNLGIITGDHKSIN